MNRTQLGTLNHLPREIRDIIYLMVLDHVIQTEVTEARRDRKVDCIKKNWDRMMLTSYHFALPSCQTHSYGPTKHKKRDAFEFYEYTKFFYPTQRLPLRDVSASIRTEFECIFLFHGTLVFRCPRTLVDFFVRINSFMRATLAHQNYIKHIVLEIFEVCDGCGEEGGYKAWTGIAEKIPAILPSLRSVKFDVGGVNHRFPYARRTGVYDPTDPRTVLFIGCNPTEIKNLRLVTDLLEVITKQWKRRAPNAEISMVETKFYTEKDNLALACVLNELEN